MITDMPAAVHSPPNQHLPCPHVHNPIFHKLVLADLDVLGLLHVVGAYPIADTEVVMVVCATTWGNVDQEREAIPEASMYAP